MEIIVFAIKDRLALVKDDFKLFFRENVYELCNIAEDRSESTDITESIHRGSNDD